MTDHPPLRFTLCCGRRAVVDDRLRVRGIDGLRIMDCSIVPMMVSGNLNGPTMAMAWRAAERTAFLEKHRDGMNLAFSLDRNEYQGETYLELTVADFKSLDGVE